MNTNSDLNPQDSTYHQAFVTSEELAEFSVTADEQQAMTVIAQEESYKMDTYEDKLSFLEMIHQEIAAKVDVTSDLYNVSGKEYVQ